MVVSEGQRVEGDVEDSSGICRGCARLWSGLVSIHNRLHSAHPSTVLVRSNSDEQPQITGATKKIQSRLIVLSLIFEQFEAGYLTEQLISKRQHFHDVLEAITIVLQYVRTSPIFDGGEMGQVGSGNAAMGDRMTSGPNPNGNFVHAPSQH